MYTDKQSLILMLTKTSNIFRVTADTVMVDTNTDGNYTTFIFDENGNLLKVTCNA